MNFQASAARGPSGSRACPARSRWSASRSASPSGRGPCPALGWWPAVVLLDRVDGQRFDVHSDLRWDARQQAPARRASWWPAAHAEGQGMAGSLVGWIARADGPVRGRSTPRFPPATGHAGREGLHLDLHDCLQLAATRGARCRVECSSADTCDPDAVAHTSPFLGDDECDDRESAHSTTWHPRFTMARSWRLVRCESRPHAS